MSLRLPRVTGKEVVRALEKAGFEVVRQSSSHQFLSHPEDRTRWATVAIHSGKSIPLGTLSTILKTSRLTSEEFKKLL